MLKVQEISLYVDGACAGNGRGPDSHMGCGVVAVYDLTGQRYQLQRHLGPGTNNLAELQAIAEGLKSIPESERSGSRVTVYTDSKYSIGVLSENHVARVNQAKITEIKLLMKGFKSVEFFWIRAHKGHHYNEITDQLAKEATKLEI